MAPVGMSDSGIPFSPKCGSSHTLIKLENERQENEPMIAPAAKPVVYFAPFHLQMTVHQKSQRERNSPPVRRRCARISFQQPDKKGYRIMSKRSRLALLSFILIIGIGGSLAQTQNPETPQTKDPAPDIAGAWTGTWGVYNPAQGTTPPRDICKKLDAKVEKGKEGVWEAIFEGDCGRPYKYTIKMEGRQIGKAVMFKGTVDLGPKDGGVFDWIGRANEKEFIGFFTSASYTGTFNLSRAKVETK